MSILAGRAAGRVRSHPAGSLKAFMLGRARRSGTAAGDPASAARLLRVPGGDVGVLDVGAEAGGLGGAVGAVPLRRRRWSGSSPGSATPAPGWRPSARRPGGSWRSLAASCPWSAGRPWSQTDPRFHTWGLCELLLERARAAAGDPREAGLLADLAVTWPAGSIPRPIRQVSSRICARGPGAALADARRRPGSPRRRAGVAARAESPAAGDGRPPGAGPPAGEQGRAAQLPRGAARRRPRLLGRASCSTGGPASHLLRPRLSNGLERLSAGEAGRPWPSRRGWSSPSAERDPRLAARAGRVVSLRGQVTARARGSLGGAHLPQPGHDQREPDPFDPAEPSRPGTPPRGAPRPAAGACRRRPPGRARSGAPPRC